jgi:catalase
MKDEQRKDLTTAAGAPVVDNQNVMTAGPRGPMLLQDVWFLEKLAHFDREVIPERRMHAKGSGAWNHREDDDYFSQPRRLFRLMTAAQKKVLFENTARAMGDAPNEVKFRHIGNCTKADPAYGDGVALALGIPVGEVAVSG